MKILIDHLVFIKCDDCQKTLTWFENYYTVTFHKLILGKYLAESREENREYHYHLKCGPYKDEQPTE